MRFLSTFPDQQIWNMIQKKCRYLYNHTITAELVVEFFGVVGFLFVLHLCFFFFAVLPLSLYIVSFLHNFSSSLFFHSRLLTFVSFPC